MNPDIVYVVKQGETNPALRYSLRSLSNLPHGRVWIAGYKPRWVTNVEHLPLRQTRTKYENSTANLLAAATHDDVSEEFVYFNDDFFVIQPMASIPILHRGPVSHVVDYYLSKYRHRRNAGAYVDGMVRTADILTGLGVDEPLSYEVHAPLPMTKTGFREAVRTASGHGITALHKRTLYGNLHGLGGEVGFPGADQEGDCKIFKDGMKWSPDWPFLSSGGAVLQNGEVGRFVRSLFPDPSPYEVPDAD